MNSLKNCIILFLLFLSVNCSTKTEETKTKINIVERECSCLELQQRQDIGEDVFYTRKCKLTIENGNTIVYKYLRGHLIEEIETYPKGNLSMEFHYDTTKRLIKRAHYYPNGHKSYQRVFGNYTYETFYENGNLQRKGGYGFTKEDRKDKYHNLHEIRLHDSLWKENGSFDYVYHYSRGSITY